MTNHIKDIARLRESANFLGYEFLTWLFLFLDKENAQEQLKKIIDHELVLANRLVTCLLNHKEQKTSIVSPLLEESHEIFASLQSGHLVESVAIKLKFSQISISALLHASDGSFSQVKIKSNYDQDSLDEQDGLSEHDKTREEIFLRMSALQDFEKVIDACYQEFIDLRLSESKYSHELAQMRQQIRDRLTSYLSSTKPARIVV